MKLKQILFIGIIGLILSLGFITCKKSSTPKLNSFDSLTQALIKRHSDFDPEFFQNKTNHHSLLRVRYDSGTYKLAEDKVFNVAGKYDSITAPGILLIKFKDLADNTLGSLSTSLPYRFIIEHPGDSIHSLGVSSIVFDLSFPSNPAIKKIEFLENLILKSVIRVPPDTVDIIDLNKTAPLDTTLF